MEMFVEYIVKKKKTGKDILKIGLIVVAMLVLMTFTTALVFTVLRGLTLFLTAGVIYGAYYLVSNLNIEYEYIVTNGELDVDMIVNRKKRKRLITAHSKTFDIVAPVGSGEHKEKENASYTRIIDASSNDNDNKAYFAVFSKDGQKIKLIFEPTEKMLEIFKTFAAKNVFTD